MNISSLHCLQILCVLLVTSSIEGCEVGWLQFQDKCYLFVHSLASWGEAQSICRAFQSKLAEPMTNSESQFLMNHAYNLGGQFWIGITDLAEENRWIYTSTQQPIKVQDFNPNNPNGQQSSNCVSMWHDYHGRWSDEPCHADFHFVCESENGIDGGLVG